MTMHSFFYCERIGFRENINDGGKRDVDMYRSTVSFVYIEREPVGVITKDGDNCIFICAARII